MRRVATFTSAQRIEQLQAENEYLRACLAQAPGATTMPMEARRLATLLDATRAELAAVQDQVAASQSRIVGIRQIELLHEGRNVRRRPNHSLVWSPTNWNWPAPRSSSGNGRPRGTAVAATTSRQVNGSDTAGAGMWRA